MSTGKAAGELRLNALLEAAIAMDIALSERTPNTMAIANARFVTMYLRMLALL